MSAVFILFPSMAAGLVSARGAHPAFAGADEQASCARSRQARFRLFKRAPLTSFGEDCW